MEEAREGEVSLELSGDCISGPKRNTRKLLNSIGRPRRKTFPLDENDRSSGPPLVALARARVDAAQARRRW